MERRYASPLLIALAIVAVLAGSVYLYWTIFRGVPELPEPEMPTVSPPREVPPPPPPQLELPDLAASDAFVRSLVEGLSSHPRLAAWLVNDHLVERFVAVVDNVARGESPRVHVPFLAPEAGFAVEQEDGHPVIAEESFRRYDLLAAAVASLDTDGAVRLYRDLAPLFEEAYAELGNPGSFELALVAAIDRLLAVEVPEGEVELSERIDAYAFADARLERLSPAAKHLLRLGPYNAHEVQTKLRTFKTALALTRPPGE
ncbi:MAG TPA: DUF3014 domain-containing protein [Thermoanaerobaculia bacterium]|jgi:hypothetical protein